VSRALAYLREREEWKRRLMDVPPDGEGLEAGEELGPREKVAKCWEVDWSGTLGGEDTLRVPHRRAPSHSSQRRPAQPSQDGASVLRLS
jgi:hypothetical protein